MPSEHQYGQRDDEVTHLEAEWGEDFLDRGEQTLQARLRGIDDPDLLRAYVNAEVGRQGRQHIIAAINQRLAEVT